MRILLEATGPVRPVPNVGGHSGAILQMAFGGKGKRLYTVGAPGEVHEWDVGSGERLRVWRFPHPAIRIALSPVKNLLVAGCVGGPPEKDGTVRSQVWIIDCLTGKMWLAATLKGSSVLRVAFSPSGDRVAVNAGKTTTLLTLKAGASAVELPITGHLSSLEFDPSGNRLLIARGRVKSGPQVLIRGTEPGGAGQRMRFPQANGDMPMAAWSPHGKRMASISGGDKPAIHIWTLVTKAKPQEWSLDPKGLLQETGNKRKEESSWTPIGVAFRSQKELLACWEHAGWVRMVLVDVVRKHSRLLPDKISRQSGKRGGMALSRNGRLLALAVNPNYKILIYDLKEGKPRMYRNPEEGRKPGALFGSPIGRPRIVGWTKNGSGIVWGRLPPERGKRTERLNRGFDLATLQRLPREECVGSQRTRLPEGWKMEVNTTQGAVLSRGSKKTSIALSHVRPALTRSFKDRAGKVRLLVTYSQGRRLAIVDPVTGKPIGKVGHLFSPLYDLAVSPDDRYVLVAGGGPALAIFDLAKPSAPLLEVLNRMQDWIAWTPQGYYAGTPGGAQLMGWLVIAKEDQPPTFYPAQSFGKKLYRPDVISRLLAEGSVESALKKTQTKRLGTTVEALLPPRVRITRVKQDDTDKHKVFVEAIAESAVDDQPIQALELRANGRPLPDNQGREQLGKGKKSHKVSWNLSKLPSGKVELKVLAFCPDVTGISTAQEVEVPEDPKNLPALHVVSIGINYEDNKDLKLDCSRNDASAIAKAFPAACIGPKNLFGQASKPEVLLDKEATAEKVVKALTRVRQRVKPPDLLVLFYAGHGVREGGEFFLLTHGAKLKNLKETALSGKVLRKNLADFPCQVLLVLDACHSVQAARALRGLEPVTDDASRQLADEECAVTLLAAALAHERALERPGAKNGLFTDALLRALSRVKEVSHNRRDGRQYVHHLFADVLDDVQSESKDRQHPVLILPMTIESFPVRRVAVPLETDR